ncbi:MAG: FAD-dependent oxidoreductase [Planctomycetota bacterium]
MISRLTIRGCGLAGVLLGWRLWQRGVTFRLEGRKDVGASKAAAGLVNPVTGKGMNTSWRLSDFLPEMKAFYGEIGALLGQNYFYEKPVLRIFSDEKERQKFFKKRVQLEPWIAKVHPILPHMKHGQWGGVQWHSGGWLNVRAFVEDSLEFFERECPGFTEPNATVYCEGAKGLQSGPFSFLPQRLAKGQIVEVTVPGWNENAILNRNGWCIPIGGDRYRVGATYEWDDLDDEPSEQGRLELEQRVAQFTDIAFTVVKQVAGVRPIIRTSQPVIGRHPEINDAFVLNGLGSKGCLYGPKVARELVSHLLDNQELDPDLDIKFLMDRRS